MKNASVYCPIIITAGSAYLDIDAYACSVAMAELLKLQGYNAIAYSKVSYNYSICPALIEPGLVKKRVPAGFQRQLAQYIIVDVSDPEYISMYVPIDQIVAVYDHHVGFEEYWNARIGGNAHIEFIGAAATLIYREWKKTGLQDKMSIGTARLLVAAILDNTLNLTSSNTTQEDRIAFDELCSIGNIGQVWCEAYFFSVQESVEQDLQNALLNDIKKIRDNAVLPAYVAQLSVWDTQRIIDRLAEIRQWMDSWYEEWMINLIDLQQKCSYFICDDVQHQQSIAKVFDVQFQYGIAKLSVAYLRKEIIKKTQSNN